MKKLFIMAVLVTAMLALAAAPALAESYNDPDGDGVLVGAGDYTRATGYVSGPHGGYNSTTNKCQDCHSTHYATGSYMLLRANSREAACDYCHVGGGGSSINIQMDNPYDASGVIADDSEGMGTGHTLGYTGNAPVDIKPAYSDANGFACFDCHTPHGNSARVLTTFANPGRAMEPTTAVEAVFAKFASVPMTDAEATAAGFSQNGAGNWVLTTGPIDVDNEAYWGLTPTEGNIVLVKDNDAAAGSVVPAVQKKPIWPTGRFLLLKNPDSNDAADTLVIDETLGQVAGDVGFEGYNKLAIDWDDPYGPADSDYGGDQNLDYNKALPWNPAPAATPDFGTDNFGLLALSEFCTDCHDGAAGASTQSAIVQVEHGGDNYAVAHSHDAQPRH